jgi:hypothetical protein
MFERRWQDIGENFIMTRFITLFFLPTVIIMNKSRRMRWAGHAERMILGMHIDVVKQSLSLAA